MISSAPRLATDFFHPKHTTNLTSSPVTENPKHKRPKIAEAQRAEIGFHWTDLNEILYSRKLELNRWINTTSWQDPEVDEFEPYGCDCKTCLLWDKMEDIAGRDLRLKKQMAWQYEEMSAHMRAYTQAITDLQLKMREMDDYSCSCELCYVHEGRQQLERLRDLRQAQILEEEKGLELSIKNLDMQRHAH